MLVDVICVFVVMKIVTVEMFDVRWAMELIASCANCARFGVVLQLAALSGFSTPCWNRSKCWGTNLLMGESVSPCEQLLLL